MNFKVSGRKEVPQSIVDIVVKTYKTSQKTKTELLLHFKKEYGLSQKEFRDIIKTIPNRKKYYVHEKKLDKIDKHGGIELIKVLRYEGWYKSAVCKYFDISPTALDSYTRPRTGKTYSEFHRREELTDKHIENIKSVYHIKEVSDEIMDS